MGAFLVKYPRDRIRSLLLIFVFVRVMYIRAALLIGVWSSLSSQVLVMALFVGLWFAAVKRFPPAVGAPSR